MNGPRAGIETATALVLALALVSTGHADEAALAAVPLPPDARSEPIRAGIVQNGRSLSVATLHASRSVPDTLAFYRERWARADGAAGAGERPGFLESEVGGWALISRLEDGVQLVVQLRAGEGERAEGFVSAMGLDAAVVTSAPPLPAGGELLSSTRTVDDGRTALTSVTAVRARVGEVAATYRDHFVRDGWTLSSDRQAGAAVVMRFVRRGRHAEVVVGDAGREESVVVLNEVADER